MPIHNRIRTQDWNFSTDPGTLVLSSRQVLEENATVLLVSRDEEGNWRFLQGTELAMGDVRFVPLDSLVVLDPSLHEVAELAPGKIARRSEAGRAWDFEELPILPNSAFPPQAMAS